MYPEKFFKVANSYYHSNKAWISIKMLKNADGSQTNEGKRTFFKSLF